MGDQRYLNNQLLIAMPSLADPNFSQTVTLVCEHSEHGALGIVLNRPLEMRLGEVPDQRCRCRTRTRGCPRNWSGSAGPCSPTAASS